MRPPVHGLVFLAALVLACSTPVGVEQADPRELREELNRSVLVGSTPSARSLQLLDRLGLADAYAKEAGPTLEAIRLGLGGPDQDERLLGLAELSFAHAERSGDRAWYRASALFAYAYLFPGTGTEQAGPFDPGLRLAAELYNRALAHGYSDGRASTLEELGGSWQIPFGKIDVAIDPGHLGWSGYRMTTFVSSSELRVRGLRNRYRRVGIGTPLTAKVVRVEGEASGHRVGDKVRIPVTAFLRIQDPHRAVRTGEVSAGLEIYALDREESVEVDGRRIPLEYEPTAALAQSLDERSVWQFERTGFFRGDFDPFPEIQNGLILLHPYRPGRVPVVLVHGTASTPGRWAELVNELNGDPALADRIQLWLFIYNTGNPVLLSAGRLRDALRETVEDLDPTRSDPALRELVMIGHSQGGLLTKLQVVDPAVRFWQNIADTPFPELELSDETRSLIRSSIFFEPLPFVKRVVYVATPHRGSYQALRRIAGFLGGFVDTSRDLSRSVVDMVSDNADAKIRRRLGDLPTSLDNMTPGDPFLVTLESLRERAGVDVHSIIAVKGVGPPEKLNDGVVLYTSARLDHAASEVVVRSGHSVQGRPETIAEVKRILFEHLEDFEGDAVDPIAPEP